ncbi:hypothetical protein QAD02_002573 [Eretmocerus hayati]|uniref:Uncharacterized protein n=1 Tax=Eretmocerus hayati TaxID=131215 RepID=A0ACC2NLY4_9HYME|nr:hypothetical protein QAD02_002573 [Eretmocerus hayati]
MLNNSPELQMHCTFNTGKLPVPYDGILGVQFLEEYGATLFFQDSCMTLKDCIDVLFPFTSHGSICLPARTRKLCRIRVKNPDKETGYVERIHVGPNIFAGECLVRNKGGYASLFIINSNSNPVN